MNLSEIAWTLLTTVEAALVACGSIEDDTLTMYRYNCQAPDDCCTEAGTLVAWPSSISPIPSPGGRLQPCTTKMQATVNLRFMRCWPCPDKEGQLPSIAVQDAAGEAMADDMVCAVAGLLSAACQNICGGITVLEATPVCPDTCCAGFVIRVIVYPTNEEPQEAT